MTVSAPGSIRVLLADDSAVIRGGLSRILESDPAIAVVASVSDGAQAVSAAAREKPDVVILDIEMPVMDGLSALPKLLEASPDSKVIMFSSLTEQGAAVTLRALALGAVECLAKPASGQKIGTGSVFHEMLLGTVRALAVAKKSRAAPARSFAPGQPGHNVTPFALRNDTRAYQGKPALIAIGSSTGGPQALFEVVKNFKGFDIPVVVTQHMPATFTKILAQHIANNTGVPAHEGDEGMTLEKGHVYVAPGGRHMHLVRDGNVVRIHLDNGPPENFCKPSVDPMLRTAISIYGRRTLGVILTGMGADGLGGGRALVEAGGRLVAQDEATSVVWGMPGAVAQAGLCSKVLPLPEIGPWVRKAVTG